MAFLLYCSIPAGAVGKNVLLLLEVHGRKVLTLQRPGGESQNVSGQSQLVIQHGAGV